MFFTEALVTLFALWADTSDLQADRLDIIMDITDVAGFLSAAWCEVSRVEIQNKWTVLQQTGKR